MVMFRDNGIIAQRGTPDMRLPIQYALTYPDRRNMCGNEFDFTKYSNLTFEEPDLDTFYALKLAYEAGKCGGNAPCVFNSADEAAVKLFLDGKISYLEISEVIAEAIKNVPFIDNPTVDDILLTDKEAREFVYNFK